MADPDIAADHRSIDIATSVVAAYVANNLVPVGELPALIAAVHAALVQLSQGGVAETAAVDWPTPAQIRKSITHDALVSFIDGKSYKTLRRHLNTHGLTIEAYRARYGLPSDYPATAAGYSERRSELARSIGLGQKRAGGSAEPASVEEPTGKAETASAVPMRCSRSRAKNGAGA